MKNKNERERKEKHENAAGARRHTDVSLMPMQHNNVALTSARRHSDAARPLRN